MPFFVGFTQPEVGFGQTAVPLGRFGEPLRRRPVIALFEVVGPHLHFILGLHWIERVLFRNQRLVFFRRRLLLLLCLGSAVLLGRRLLRVRGQDENQRQNPSP